jgi:rare lipoprotein A
MKHHVLSGLTVAVTMSVFGAPLPGHAQDTGDTSRSLGLQAEHQIDASFSSFLPNAGLPIDSSPSTLEPVDPDAEPLVEPASPGAPVTFVPETAAPEAFAPQTLDIATIFPHALDSRQAATLYLRSIPVVTLVGAELATLSPASADKSTPLGAQPDGEQDPVLRAQVILDRLQQLAAEGDATAIQARWDSESEVFVVAWGDEDLFTIDEQTILPDTTGEPGEDVLQVANRLRRLLGDAPPLARVEGLPTPPPPDTRVGVVASTLTGTASWYGPGFHGRRSASGEVFDQNALTAAHRTLPFGTQVRVTSQATGQSVVVRINDRGPFGHGRIIDLSAGAASRIGLRASGVGQVRLEVLSSQ